MWLTHTGQCVQVLAGHDGAVTSGCFSKDGKFVCTGGEDGTIRIWAPKTGRFNYLCGLTTLYKKYIGAYIIVIRF